MITPGQTLSNPVTGERFTFIETAATTGGDLLSFELGLRPGGSVPIQHVHPIQTERFEVVEGRMRFRLGLRTVVAGPGEVVEVAPGVMHGFANAGDSEARVRVEVRPALRMEEMFAEVVAMAEAGRMTRRGMPRNLLDLAVLARRYDREAHAPFVNVAVQRLLLAPLVFAARYRRKTVPGENAKPWTSALKLFRSPSPTSIARRPSTPTTPASTLTTTPKSTTPCVWSS